MFEMQWFISVARWWWTGWYRIDLRLITVHFCLYIFKFLVFLFFTLTPRQLALLAATPTLITSAMSLPIAYNVRCFIGSGLRLLPYQIWFDMRKVNRRRYWNSQRNFHEHIRFVTLLLFLYPAFLFWHFIHFVFSNNFYNLTPPKKVSFYVRRGKD